MPSVTSSVSRPPRAPASTAEAERQGIVAGIADGHLSLMTALQLIGGFLVLMFFFLLTAIERHQRKLARRDASVLDPEAETA